MRTMIAGLSALLLLTACAAAQKEKVLEISDETPVSVSYMRRYEYALDIESSDPDLIRDLTEKIGNITYGKESHMETIDYTDILVFTMADGSRNMYEFEADNIVIGRKRYEVTGGLKELRASLEEFVRSMGYGDE